MDKDNGGLNIQDSYLGRARKDRGLLTVFLNNGKKIVGRIRSFDRYTVILEDHGQEQMIFKHAISTISVSRSFANPIPLDRAAKVEPPADRDPAAPVGGQAGGTGGGPTGGLGGGQAHGSTGGHVDEADESEASAPPADKPRVSD
jgi:host factor-I protein